MKIIGFDDAMRAQADARPAGCGLCGDDLGIHNWIGISRDGEIVACDRDSSTAAGGCEVHGDVLTPSGHTMICAACGRLSDAETAGAFPVMDAPWPPGH